MLVPVECVGCGSPYLCDLRSRRTASVQRVPLTHPLQQEASTPYVPLMSTPYVLGLNSPYLKGYLLIRGTVGGTVRGTMTVSFALAARATLLLVGLPGRAHR